jgi:hypothetical protein
LAIRLRYLDSRPLGVCPIDLFSFLRANEITSPAMICIPALALLFTFIFTYLWLIWRHLREGQTNTASNGRVRSKQWIAKDMQGCGCDQRRCHPDNSLGGAQKSIQTSVRAIVPVETTSGHFPNTNPNSYIVGKYSQCFFFFNFSSLDMCVNSFRVPEYHWNNLFLTAVFQCWYVFPSTLIKTIHVSSVGLLIVFSCSYF